MDFWVSSLLSIISRNWNCNNRVMIIIFISGLLLGFQVISQDPACTSPGTVSNPGAKCMVKSGNRLAGMEGNGLIRFTGTSFDSISW